MARPQLLLALTLAGCAAAADPAPRDPQPEPAPRSSSSSRGIDESKRIPWQGERLKELDWPAFAPKAPADRSDQILAVALPGEPETWDPHRAYDESSVFVARACFEGLVTRHPETCQPIPAIAAWWDVSPDRKVYTFHLRSDARWNDGTTITAADVQWSLARALDQDTDAPLRSLLASLLPAAAAAGLRGGDTEGGTPGSELAVVGERTLRVTLPRPDPRLLHALAEPGAVAVHRASVEKHGKRAFDPEHLVCSGAFTRPSGAAPQGGATTLSRNKNHWMHERTWLSSVLLTWPERAGDSLLPAYARGAVDWVPWCLYDDLEPSRALPGAYAADGPAVQFLCINDGRADRAVANVDLRRALGTSTDGDALAGLLGGGSAAAARFVPASLPGLPALKPLRRTTAGLQRWESSTANGRLELLVSDYPPERSAAAALSVIWADRLGVVVQAVPLGARTLRARIAAGDFDLALAGHFEPLPHPLGYFESPLLNWIWDHHPKLDYLRERAQAQPVPEDLRTFTALERELLHDLAVLVPLTRNRNYGVLRPAVKGLTPNVLNEHRLRYLRLAPK